jgi:magnesium transporter
MKAVPGGPNIRCFAARNGSVHAAPRDEVVRLVREAPRTIEAAPSDELVWIDITDPGEDEAVLLRDKLGMHHLAVEDCLRGRQRPKLDRYAGYYFIVFYATRINPDRARMALNEIHLFLGNNFLITVHDQEVPEVSKIVATWRMDPSRLKDAAAVAHALFDAVIDNYFPVVEHFSDRLEQIEDRIFNDASGPTLEDAFLLRHEMITMRRILAPQRDVLSSLVRHDLPFVRPELVPYFQDVHDHVLRVTEEIDAFRDVLTGLVDVQATKASNRLNATVQTLTAWSIILMTIAVIAGIYGMNFTFMPELEVPWGYYAVLGLMLATAIALITFFRRRGWL